MGILPSWDYPELFSPPLQPFHPQRAGWAFVGPIPKETFPSPSLPPFFFLPFSDFQPLFAVGSLQHFWFLKKVYTPLSQFSSEFFCFLWSPPELGPPPTTFLYFPTWFVVETFPFSFLLHFFFLIQGLFVFPF